jgi:hypothetical protein
MGMNVIQNWLCEHYRSCHSNKINRVGPYAGCWCTSRANGKRVRSTNSWQGQMAMMHIACDRKRVPSARYPTIRACCASSKATTQVLTDPVQRLLCRCEVYICHWHGVKCNSIAHEANLRRATELTCHDSPLPLRVFDRDLGLMDTPIAHG